MFFFDFFDFSLLLICITYFGDEDMTIKVYQGHLFHLTSPPEAVLRELQILLRDEK